MATRRTAKKGKHSQHKRKASTSTPSMKANLGQKEARLESEMESKLSHMGERSRRGQTRP
jgi:hypothetical protein